jgi:hypothetical protein
MNFLGGLGDFGDLDGDFGDLDGDLGDLDGDFGDLDGDLGVFGGDRFAENIPPRLVRLKRLVLPIILDIYYEYIMNIHNCHISILTCCQAIIVSPCAECAPP